MLNGLDGKLRVVSGSSWLEKATGGTFSTLSDREKAQWRVRYTQYLATLPDEHIISDGHYAFEDTVVFTEHDGDLYDVFLYLYCEPEELLSRMARSEKNKRFSHLTVEEITAWQNREVEQLRLQCHKRSKDFYVIPSGKDSAFAGFIEAILSGFSQYRRAAQLVAKIQGWFPAPCTLSLVDGDRTFLCQDSLRLCANGFHTAVFDGNFYTGYQAYCFEKETGSLSYAYEKLDSCTRSQQVWCRISGEPYVILSAGIPALWEKVGERMEIPYILASPLICADTKYYVAKLLRGLGYRVKGYGDSKPDLYMLREADEGYLCLGERISRSLEGADVSGVQFLWDWAPFVLAQTQDQAVAGDIAICKSSSGIHGSRLAQAHFSLGVRMGRYVRNVLPNQGIPVLVLERSGRFFGDGFYIGFGGQLYPCDPKRDVLPVFKSNLVVIVDGVIHTGASVLDMIERLRRNNPAVQICIVTNVMQKESLPKFREYALFAVRVSENKFVGKRQKKQHGSSGPDTADRLFNLLDE